ncbi:hypothetical protein V5799_029618 [Amblyomma americanum]|uniref:Neurotransmitter-gated ion-channel ligand-binding domain-containing protein n=1 Tax=Amblyomma americanum TaxID=6943 RepID=A0AAQ4EQN7_AMBAM
MLQYWKDHRLTWNAREYGDMAFIAVDPKDVWSPDLDVVNARREDFYSLKNMLTAQPDGSVWACFSVKVKAPCAVDMSGFPHDEQLCGIRITSTAYSDSQVKLAEGTVWGSHQDNASTEWNVTGISFAEHRALNRSFLDVSFHMRRLSRRHRHATTVPWVASALVMLSTFWIPAHSRHRVAVACLNLFFVTLVLSRVAPLLGSSSATPHMLLFLGLATVVQVFAAAVHPLVLCLLSSRTSTGVPVALYHVVNGPAGTALCLCDHEPTGDVSARPEDVRQPSAFEDTSFCDNTEEIKRLRKDLLHSGKYQRTVKPQGDVNGTTVLSLELKPVSVPTLTPKRHHLFMNAFVCLSWMDKRLTWVTDKYGGLEGIFVNSSEMWTPSVIHLSPFLAPHLSPREPNRRTSLDFDLGRYVYPQIIFRVLLERRTSLHLFTVLVPTVAVVLLSLLVFWLPPESPRKLTLIGAAMLTSLLLLYRAEDVVSGSSGVPKIVKVLGGAVLLNSLIAATTVLSINMARRPPSFTLPVALVRCTEFLAFRVPCPCPGGQTGAEDDGGVQNKSFSNAVAREWYTAARALDRVLGLVFSAAFVVLCL